MAWQYPCSIPILQAPIGSAAGIDLCSGVSEAGALGGLALTWRGPGSVQKIVQGVRSRTDLPFYGNYALHFDPKTLNEAIESGIPILTFSWGDPSPYIAKVKSAGIATGVQVTSIDSAKRMLDLGVDFLIVQGIEAGGHVQASRPLLDTLIDVVECAHQTPVFAAGGLANGGDLRQVMRVGASGGVFGTRFLASVESEAHPEYKERLVHSNSSETVLTTCFDIGWPNAQHRVLQNSTFKQWESHGCPSTGNRPGEGDVLAYTASGESIIRYEDTMPRLDYKGEWEPMCLYAGASVDRVSHIMPASAIVQQIWKEAQDSDLL